ncbi:hypothetical protein RRG08_002757 [Elysia crispata]|uniref:Uncharacterized protein n=1 Tax=Elysia crispata TaxID=231223 RepID=A0AAE0XTV6_9GAST|nr:hypothetical protein RRG08_002757 [Elysia crispata]
MAIPRVKLSAHVTFGSVQIRTSVTVRNSLQSFIRGFSSSDRRTRHASMDEINIQIPRSRPRGSNQRRALCKFGALACATELTEPHRKETPNPAMTLRVEDVLSCALRTLSDLLLSRWASCL